MISKDIIELRRDVGLALDSLGAKEQEKQMIWEAYYLGYSHGIMDTVKAAQADDDPWDRSKWA